MEELEKTIISTVNIIKSSSDNTEELYNINDALIEFINNNFNGITHTEFINNNFNGTTHPYNYSELYNKSINLDEFIKEIEEELSIFLYNKSNESENISLLLDSINVYNSVDVVKWFDNNTEMLLYLSLTNNENFEQKLIENAKKLNKYKIDDDIFLDVYFPILSKFATFCLNETEDKYNIPNINFLLITIIALDKNNFTHLATFKF